VLLDSFVDFASSQQKTGRRVKNLDDSTADAEKHLLGRWKKSGSKGAAILFRINRRHDGQRMRPELIERVRMKLDIRVKPKQLLESLSQRVAGCLVPALVDRCKSGDSPNHVAAPFQFHQRPIAIWLHSKVCRNEHDTSISFEHFRRILGL